MFYKVINTFKDKEDGTLYQPGDKYPKSGKATQKRLDELTKVHSEHKVAFIREEKEEEVAEDKKEEATPSKNKK